MFSFRGFSAGRRETIVGLGPQFFEEINLAQLATAVHAHSQDWLVYIFAHTVLHSPVPIVGLYTQRGFFLQKATQLCHITCLLVGPSRGFFHARLYFLRAPKQSANGSKAENRNITDIEHLLKIWEDFKALFEYSTILGGKNWKFVNKLWYVQMCIINNKGIR